MARANRRDVLADQEIQVVHCINRCVRRAFLCGDDKVSGKNYDQRRELIRQRLEFLAGIMGIEVLGYAVMSNHFHCVLCSRPDVVATWSDDEVARKWWMLCPALKNPDGSPAEPAEIELKAIRNDRKGLKENGVACRASHGSCGFCPKRSRRMPTSRKQGPPLSGERRCRPGPRWRKESVLGRPLQDAGVLAEAAILACMQSVDLNPIRAGLAESSGMKRNGASRTVLEFIQRTQQWSCVLPLHNRERGNGTVLLPEASFAHCAFLNWSLFLRVFSRVALTGCSESSIIHLEITWRRGTARDFVREHSDAG